MKRIILSVMAVTLSGSIFAEQTQPTSVFKNAPDARIMTSIEEKNRNIMSSYGNYSQFRQLTQSVRQRHLKQQYSQYLEQKSILSSTAGL